MYSKKDNGKHSTEPPRIRTQPKWTLSGGVRSELSDLNIAEMSRLEKREEARERAEGGSGGRERREGAEGERERREGAEGGSGGGAVLCWMIL